MKAHLVTAAGVGVGVLIGIFLWRQIRVTVPSVVGSKSSL